MAILYFLTNFFRCENNYAHLFAASICLVVRLPPSSLVLDIFVSEVHFLGITVGSQFVIQSIRLHLLIGGLRPFPFTVIIEGGFLFTMILQVAFLVN